MFRAGSSVLAGHTRAAACCKGSKSAVGKRTTHPKKTAVLLRMHVQMKKSPAASHRRLGDVTSLMQAGDQGLLASGSLECGWIQQSDSSIGQRPMG